MVLQLERGGAGLLPCPFKGLILVTTRLVTLLPCCLVTTRLVTLLPCCLVTTRLVTLLPCCLATGVSAASKKTIP